MNSHRIIAIDGASRNNGKPDCISSAGVYFQDYEEDTIVGHQTLSTFEKGSTNQRGEMLALLTALDYIVAEEATDTFILTDSEYIYNAITKEWSLRWAKNGWLTAEGRDVANRDLWEKINEKIISYRNPIYYHIKGHLVSLGKVTAAAILAKDTTGALVYAEALKKFELMPAAKQEEAVRIASELSEKNMGYPYDFNTIQKFAALNLVADTVATQCVERVKSLQS